MRRIVPIIVEDDAVTHVSVEYCRGANGDCSGPYEHPVAPNDQLTRDLHALTRYIFSAEGPRVREAFHLDKATEGDDK